MPTGRGTRRRVGDGDQSDPGAGMGAAGAELVCLDSGKGRHRGQAPRSQW